MRAAVVRLALGRGLLAALLAASWWGGLPAQPGPEFLGVLTAAESRQYQAKPDYRSRMDLLRKVLRRQVEQVRRGVLAKNFDRAAQTLAEMRTVSDHGLELTASIAAERDFRSKKVRKLEIELRRIAELLEDLMSAPPFEYRNNFEATVNALYRFRERLLHGYFHDLGEPPQHPQKGLAMGLTAHTGTAEQRGLESTVSGDQFTYDEEEAIRDAQELRPRVKVLLKIAGDRLEEVSRRLSQRAWDKEEPNPLEFLTLAQLMRGYWRALETMMINVDEKARLGLASKKEIRKSLKLINSHMQEFIPKLDPIRKLAIEKQDEDLFVETRKARRISDQALNGSQLGLGAPVPGDS